MSKEATLKRAVKSIVLAQSFVEVMDEFEGTNEYRQQLKNKGSLFVKEMDKYLNGMYKDGAADGQLIQLIEKCQQAVDKVMDNHMEIID